MSDTPERENSGTLAAVSIGDRLQRRLVTDMISKTLDEARAPGGEPESIGLIQVSVVADESMPLASAAAGSAAELARWIEVRLPRRSRVVIGSPNRFWLVLPGEPLLDALLLVDRLRDLLARECWRREGIAVDIEAAGGVATRRGPAELVGDLMAAAERSLASERHLEVRRHGDAHGAGAPSIATRANRTTPSRPSRWPIGASCVKAGD